MSAPELTQLRQAQKRPASWKPVESASRALNPVHLLKALDVASRDRRNSGAAVQARILVLRTLALTALSLAEGPAAALGVESCARSIWPKPVEVAGSRKPATPADDAAARRQHLANELLKAVTHMRLQGLPSFATPLPSGTDTHIDATPPEVRAALLGMPADRKVRALAEPARCHIAARAGMLYVMSKVMAIHPRLGVQRLPGTRQVVLSRRVVVAMAATTAAQVGLWTATSPEGVLVQKAVRHSCTLPRERHEKEIPSDFTVMCRSLGLIDEGGRAIRGPQDPMDRGHVPTL